MFSDEYRQLKSAFKALADDNRMRMIGLLAGCEHTVSDLAAMLNVKEPTVSHHLSKLRAIGFVNLRVQGNQHFYRLNQENIKRFKAAVAKIEEFAPDAPADNDLSWIDALPIDESDKKILRDYTFAGRLQQIPTKEQKLLVILNWLVLQFDADKTYTEREVNQIITRYHDDYATLRRGLISYGYLRRERGGASYWVTPEDDTRPSPGW